MVGSSVEGLSTQRTSDCGHPPAYYLPRQNRDSEEPNLKGRGLLSGPFNSRPMRSRWIINRNSGRLGRSGVTNKSLMPIVHDLFRRKLNLKVKFMEYKV